MKQSSRAHTWPEFLSQTVTQIGQGSKRRVKPLFLSQTVREIGAAALDTQGPHAYTASHIRPLAVSPLNHPESVPIPWGFSISALPICACPIAGKGYA